MSERPANGVTGDDPEDPRVFRLWRIGDTVRRRGSGDTLGIVLGIELTPSSRVYAVSVIGEGHLRLTQEELEGAP